MRVFRNLFSCLAPASLFGLGAVALFSVRPSSAADGAATAGASAAPAGAVANAPSPVVAIDGGAARPLTAGLGRGYVNACQRGNAQYASRDFPSAIASYQAAISQEPHAPLGYYLLGEAQLAAGSLGDAEASWRRALSESNRDPAMHARTLFVLADLKERQKVWDEAKAAWQAYRDWLTQYPAAGGFASSAEARRDAIDRMTEQERTSAIVRQRIQETADGGVFTSVPGEPVTP